MSLAACISRWPCTTRWPCWRYRLRGRCSSSADAADAHHLAGEVDDLEVPEQVPHVRLQGCPVGLVLLADQLSELLGRRSRRQVTHREDDRRLADDPVLAVMLLA